MVLLFIHVVHKIKKKQRKNDNGKYNGKYKQYPEFPSKIEL